MVATTRPTGSGVLLQLIRSGPAHSRRELLDELGWSRSTLAKRLEELRVAGLIVTSGQQDSTGGRPAEVISLNQSAGLILSVDIGASHSRLGITDLASNVLIEDEADILIGSGPSEVFEWAQQVFDYLLERLGRTRADVRAIGISVPDAVDPATARLNNPIMMPEWAGATLTDYLAPIYPDAVFALGRDVNVMAVAEHRNGWPEVQDFALVKVSSGVGCGLILNGTVHRGAHGGAGDLGHVIRRDEDGRTGTLDEIASGWSVQRELVSRGMRVRTTSDIVALARRGDEATVGELRRIATTLGEALVDTVSLINPAVLVIGGTLAEAGEPVIGPIRDLIGEQATTVLAGIPEITVARLGRRAAVIGASLFAQDALFEADRISALTAGLVGGSDDE